MNTSKKTLMLCEGAICVALAAALNLWKIDVGVQGGSFKFVMIPLILFAVHSGGLGWGVLAGAVYGILQMIMGFDSAITWQSILLDYAVAYGAVGLAGIMKGRGWQGYLLGALIGCIARYIVHVISGVALYAEYAEDVYFGVSTPNPLLYSIVYNAIYMVFNTIAAVIVTPVIGAALDKMRLTGRSAA